MNQQCISKKPLSIAIKTALVSTTVVMLSQSPVQADEVGEIKQVIKELQQRLNTLESKQEEQNKLVLKQSNSTKVQTPPALVNKSEITSNIEIVEQSKPREIIRNQNHQIPDGNLVFKLGGGDTKVTVGGYVKLDAMVDSDQDVGDSFVFSSIAPDGSAASERNPHFRLHAKQTRLQIKSEGKLNGVDLKTKWEGDFFGSSGNQSFSNSDNFRMRHAWIEYGNWGFGQTWSNFQENNFVAYPGTVDFFGPVGQSFVRQAQIRYTKDNWSVSVENPETDGTGLAGRLRESTNVGGSDEFPDITAAWRGGPGGAGGSYEVGAVYRKLGVKADTNGDGTIDLDESEDGYGIMLAGGWQLGKAYLYGHYNFGDGIGRYIINGAANDLFVNTDGTIETVESHGGNVGVTFDVTPSDKLNLTYGFFENDNPARSNGIDNLQSIHASYIKKIGGGLSLGAEVIYGEIENADGSEGDNTRFQIMAQKNF